MDNNKTVNPDKEHFDKMLLKDLVWKIDREVWAHVQNPEPSEEWSTSKAREETTKLLKEYLGDIDAVKKENSELKEWKKQMLELWSPLLDYMQEDPLMKIGYSIAEEALRRCKLYPQLLSKIKP